MGYVIEWSAVRYQLNHRAKQPLLHLPQLSRMVVDGGIFAAKKKAKSSFMVTVRVDGSRMARQRPTWHIRVRIRGEVPTFR